MDSRRKTLGRRIQRGRRNAGYRSQRAFAEAIGLHESSVANAERGDDSVGHTVFDAIEAGLKWPEDSIATYLETGDASVLLATGQDAAAEADPTLDLRNDEERALWESVRQLPEGDRWMFIDLLRAYNRRHSGTDQVQSG